MNRQRKAVESQLATVLKRRREIVDRKTLLRHHCLCVCGKPATLATAFATGGLVGASTVHGLEKTANLANPPASAHPELWGTLRALALGVATRYLADRLSSSRSGGGDKAGETAA